MFTSFRLCRKDEISFDIVAKNGNDVEATFDFVEMTNITINTFEIVAIFGNKVECWFHKVERCFDIVGSVNGA